MTESDNMFAKLTNLRIDDIDEKMQQVFRKDQSKRSYIGRDMSRLEMNILCQGYEVLKLKSLEHFDSDAFAKWFKTQPVEKRPILGTKRTQTKTSSLPESELNNFKTQLRQAREEAESVIYQQSLGQPGAELVKEGVIIVTGEGIKRQIPHQDIPEKIIGAYLKVSHCGLFYVQP
jgi:hypothetical protein